MSTRSLVAVLCGAAAFGLSATQDVHATQIDVASVTASSEIVGAFDRIDDHLIDGSGLNALGEHSNAPDTNMWLSSGAGSFGGVDPDPNVVFDLGAVFNVDTIRVWNYNENSGNPTLFTKRGVNAATIQYGNTPALGNTVAGITNFAQADGSATYTGETFNAFAAFDARYIKIDIGSGHGGDNGFVGLSEVQFDGSLANVIGGVTIEDFSSELSAFGDRLAVDTINGSGFDAVAGTHNTDAGAMWLTDGPFQSDEGNDVLPSHITYDLEGNYDLDALHVWNYNEAAAGNTDRGAQDVEISVASSEGGSFTSLGSFVFDQATGLTGDEGQVIALYDLAGTDNVRLIRFDITTNWGDGDNVVGLSEVRFSGTVIPEPSSLALLGLGGLLVARRRR